MEAVYGLAKMPRPLKIRWLLADARAWVERRLLRRGPTMDSNTSSAVLCNSRTLCPQCPNQRARARECRGMKRRGSSETCESRFWSCEADVEWRLSTAARPCGGRECERSSFVPLAREHTRPWLCFLFGASLGPSLLFWPFLSGTKRVDLRCSTRRQRADFWWASTPRRWPRSSRASRAASVMGSRLSHGLDQRCGSNALECDLCMGF